MTIERTLSIVKPDAVAKNKIGEICARFEKAGLKIVASRMLHLSRPQADLRTSSPVRRLIVAALAPRSHEVEVRGAGGRVRGITGRDARELALAP